ncbi:MAG: 3-methyl-2-oxobutanoate dehydrogenase subunit VorB [Oscillospiraceae bacterium]
MAEQRFMKGNEAIAEAAIRAGCRFYAGYPITPQSELLEYMGAHMTEAGGAFVQGESEVASISMVWGAACAGTRAMTSSSGPGFDLKQEGIAYLASYDVPAVIVSMMRYGIGGGDITAGQDSYLQATKGGGNGDYRLIVLCPNSVQECVDMAYNAFDLAEKYRNTVLILGDGAIGQMMQNVQLPEPVEHNIDSYDWVIKGRKAEEKKNKATNLNWYMGDRAWEEHVYNKLHTLQENEQRWENYMVEDADLVFVAIGVSSRVAKHAVKLARAEGIKLGLVRPITAWPFPRKAFEAVNPDVKGYMVVEMSIVGQMIEDVYGATRYAKPVYKYCTAIDIPVAEDVLSNAKAALAGNLKVEVAL